MALQELKTSSLGQGRRKSRFSRRHSEYYTLEDEELGEPVARRHTTAVGLGDESQALEAVGKLQLEMQALHGHLMAQLQEIRQDLHVHRAQSEREEAQSEPRTAKEA